MPTPTARFPFEHRLARWADGLSHQLTGERRALFIGFRDDGSLRRVYVLPPGQVLDADRKAALAAAYGAWFLATPYELGNELYLEWLALEPEVAAVWLGGPIAPDLLRGADGDALEGWPRAWRVIVG